jgi:glycerophosphoryl diester phosphodiesterase
LKGPRARLARTRRAHRTSGRRLIDGARLPLVIAHRGASGRAPENTLRAFRAAIADGASVLECDVRPTRDGVPVIFHDATLERLAGRAGRIEDLSADEVRRLRIVAGPAARRGGERVPLLEELAALARGRAHLAAELKLDGRADLRFVRKVIRLLRASGHGDAAIISFSPLVVDYLHVTERWPLAGLILGAGTAESAVRRALLRPEPLLVLQKSLLRRRVLSEAQARGKRVWTYSVDGTGEQRRLAAGVLDGIITNVPARLAGKRAR